MTLITLTDRNDYVGAGTVGPFSYTFRIFAATDLKVIKRVVATGVETPLTLTTHYTVSGVGVVSGGSVTLVSALAVGEVLAIIRDAPLTQEIDLTNQGPFFPSTYENALDKATMLIQRLNEKLKRTFTLSETSTISPILPSPVANKLLGWNGGATALENKEPGAGGGGGLADAATLITVGDETPALPNSKRLIGGSGISVDVVGDDVAVTNTAVGSEELRDVDKAYEVPIPIDGVTSSVAALTDLFALYGSAFRTLLIDGTLLIDSDFEIPYNIHLMMYAPAKIKIVDSTLYAPCFLEAGPYPLFEFVGTGKVKFQKMGSAVGPNQRGSFTHHIKTEWFNILANYSNNDTLGWERLIDAANGPYPSGSPLNGRSWATLGVEFPNGGLSLIRKPLRITAETGFSLRGSGRQNSFFLWDHRPTLHSITAVAGSTMTLSVPPEADASSGRMWVLIVTGASIGAAWRVVSVAGSDVVVDTTGSADLAAEGFVYEAGLQAYIVWDCIIDHNGSFNTTFQEMSISPAEGSVCFAMNAVYYHRDQAETISGSTQGHFTNVSVHDCWARAAWSFGNFRRGNEHHQEDLTISHGIGAFGRWYSGLDATQKLWRTQMGIGCGAGGAPSNNLNHTIHGVSVSQCRYGVVVGNSNFQLFGGTVQTCEASYYFVNSGQGTLTVDSVRDEDSEQLIKTATVYSGFSQKVVMRNVILRGEYLKRIAGTGRCRFVQYDWPGHLELGIVMTAFPHIWGASGQPFSTITAVGADWFEDSAGVPLALNELVGAQINIGPASAVYITDFVKSNTAGIRVVSENAWATQGYTPLVGDSYRITAVPLVEMKDTSRTTIDFTGSSLNGTLDRIVQINGPDNAWESRRFSHVNVESQEVGYGSVHESYRVQERVISVDLGDQSGAGFIFYWFRAKIFKIRVTGAFTFTIGGAGVIPLPPNGQKFKILLKQDGTGGRAITWQADALFPIVWTGGAAPPAGGPDSTQEIDFYCDGSRWLATLVNDQTAAITSKSANYIATADDRTILMDASGGARTVTLPLAATSNRVVLTIKKIDSSANAVTIDGNGAETIDGAATQVLAAQWDSFTIQCNGTAWFIL